MNSIFAVYFVESLLIGKFGWLIGWLIVHLSPTNCNNRQHGADNDTDVGRFKTGFVQFLRVLESR